MATALLIGPIPTTERRQRVHQRDHSDLERGFIRAEMVSFDELVACGSLDVERERGLVRVEGRDYVVREGDVALTRHSS